MKFGQKIVSELNCDYGCENYLKYEDLFNTITSLEAVRQSSGVAIPTDVELADQLIQEFRNELARITKFFTVKREALAQETQGIDSSADSLKLFIELSLLNEYAKLNISGLEAIVKKLRKRSVGRTGTLQQLSQFLVEVHDSQLAHPSNQILDDVSAVYARTMEITTDAARVALEDRFRSDPRGKPRVVDFAKSPYYRAPDKLEEKSYVMRLISGTANPQLAQDVAEVLGKDLEETRIGCFANGEIDIKIVNNIRGDDVFIIQTMCGSRANPQDINTAVMELLLLIHTLRLSSVKRITAIVPYLAYSRQDRKTQPRVPISAAALAQMLKTMGLDRLITLDLHCGQIQGFYVPLPVDNLLAMKEFVRYLKESNAKIPKEQLAIVSPDAGGVERARCLADSLSAPSVVTILKRRVEKNKVDSMQIVGDVQGKTCIIIDDMIDTAGTLVKACQLLADNGAAGVIACASHGILTDPALDRINKCDALKEVIVTDSLPQKENLKRCNKLRVVSIAPLIAETVRRVHNESSLSELFKF